MSKARNSLHVLATAFALVAVSPAFAADGGTWSVSKSSGEVWVMSGEVQPASLKPEDSLKPGDTIRTGRNGRVLLVRGEESILVAPNSVVGLPPEVKEGLSTTIVQRAGSILLEVEKRNVKHFEVETPYLAAVVKGTQFKVSVNAASTSVEVMRGQVEVADFKSGQVAQVMPGQRATALENGKAGLSLSGSGPFNPIEQGKPRPSSVDRVPVPKGGFSVREASSGGLRIAAALGEVKLDVRRATGGLARDANGANASNRNIANNGGNSSNSTNSSTVWSSSSPTTSSGAAASTSSAASNALSSASPVATAVAVATNAGSSNAGGNGIGNAFGLGKGNGNGGVGNGKGLGNLKH
jgi:hypothetical protein